MKKQNRTLLVLKYLWDNTDIDHPATIKDIAAYLEGYGYNATRKTISKDIDLLPNLLYQVNRIGELGSMKKKITYTECDGYLYPDFELPEQEEVVIGRWT